MARSRKTKAAQRPSGKKDQEPKRYRIPSLTVQINKFYWKNRAQSGVKDKFEPLRALIESTVQSKIPDCRVEFFGSIASGLMLKRNSDIDLTLLTDDKIPPEVLIARASQVLKNLTSYPILTIWIKAGRLLQMKIDYKGKIYDIDLMINRHFELNHAKLLNRYCRLNNEFRKVCLVLKAWQKQKKSEIGQKNSLNSFAIICMLLAYLHDKQIVPDLQRQPTTTSLKVKQRLRYLDRRRKGGKCVHQELVDKTIEGQINMPTNRTLKDLAEKQQAGQKSNTGEILKGFFEYYAFTYPKTTPIINVSNEGASFVQRNQSNVTKMFSSEISEANWGDHYFLIREPFNPSYNPAKALLKSDKIKPHTMFEQAFDLLNSNQSNAVELLTRI